MKWPKRRPNPSSHTRVLSGSSGAAPYSMLRNFSATLVFAIGLPSDEGVMVGRRIAPAAMEFQLPLDIAKDAAGTNPEQLRPKPTVSELFLHQREPVKRLSGGADPAGRLETYGHAGALAILANRARHHYSHWERRVDSLLAGGGLDEIRARHHGDDACPPHVAQRRKITGTQDDLAVRIAAGLLEGRDLVVEALPLPREHMCSGDHDIDLISARIDRSPDLSQTLLERVQASGKAGRYGRHADRRTLERASRRRHEMVVDAHGCHLHR